MTGRLNACKSRENSRSRLHTGAVFALGTTTLSDGHHLSASPVLSILGVRSVGFRSRKSDEAKVQADGAICMASLSDQNRVASWCFIKASRAAVEKYISPLAIDIGSPDDSQ